MPVLPPSRGRPCPRQLFDCTHQYQFTVLRNVKNTGIWIAKKLPLTKKQVQKYQKKTSSEIIENKLKSIFV